MTAGRPAAGSAKPHPAAGLRPSGEPDQDDWLRLFMLPGVAHCGGGAGPDQFNALAAPERWREQNEPPRSITAVRVNERGVDMTRPLCPYPRQTIYKGAGSTNAAANYTCGIKR